MIEYPICYPHGTFDSSREVPFPEMGNRDKHYDHYGAHAYLRLVANDIDAPWVNKSDNAIWVVSWKELCGHW